MYISKFVIRASFITLLASIGLITTANAAVIPIGTVYSFNLTISQPSAGLPGGPYGTVQLTQQNNDVDVLVTLASGFAFANTGAGSAFVFNLASAFSNAVVTVNAPSTTWFALNSSPPLYNQTPYGEFTNSIDFKTGVGNGLSDAITSPLSFSVAKSGIMLTDFALSSAHNNGQPGGYRFSADIGYLATGKTGPVANIDGGGGGNNGEVPEPATLLLLSLGALGAAVVRRRSKA
jgi:hypothetical protein